MKILLLRGHSYGEWTLKQRPMVMTPFRPNLVNTFFDSSQYQVMNVQRNGKIIETFMYRRKNQPLN